mmetsp:Transcript_20998/g.30254  ORF Transcript_20998/g.30254 Transcript_20998/m.30254 type:complete len:630 (+) Transcript_20998:39-1928(+)
MKSLSSALILFSGYIFGDVVGQTSPECITDLETILSAEGQLEQRQIAESRTYILCPNTIFETGFGTEDGNIADGQYPLVVRSNARVLCGEDGKSENNCIITIGQFAIFLNTYDFFNDLSMDNVLIQGLTIQDMQFNGDVPIVILANKGSITFRDFVYKSNSAAPSFVVVQNELDALLSGGRRRRNSVNLNFNTQKTNSLSPFYLEGPGNRRLQNFPRCDLETPAESLFFFTIEDSLFEGNQNVPGSDAFRGAFFDGGSIIQGSGEAIQTYFKRNIWRNNIFPGENNYFGLSMLHQSCSPIIIEDNCFEGNTWSGGVFFTYGNFATTTNNYIDAPVADSECDFIARYDPVEGDPFRVGSCLGTFDATSCQARAPTPAPTPPPTPGPSGGGFCFPGDAMVQIQNGEFKQMASLEIGDKVLVEDGKFSEVYSFAHRNEDAITEYLQFNEQLELTADHMLFVDGNYAPASTVKLGSVMKDANDNDIIVTSIATIHKPGAYGPFTMSGKIVVNGILASCYLGFHNSGSIKVASFVDFTWQWLDHTFNFPHRFAYNVLGMKHETYSEEGLSNWVSVPVHLMRRLLRQPKAVLSTVLIPAILVYGIFAALETMPTLVALAVIALLVCRRRHKLKQL